MAQVIVVGGGLAGLSAAHTVLERGGSVLLLEKLAFCGGNSTKATSGINAALTRTQQRLGIHDTVDSFLKDTAEAAIKGASPKEAAAKQAEMEGKDAMDPAVNPYLDNNKRLVYDSAPSVEWLIEKFGLDLSLVGRLGGHAFPRTHRGKQKFPGMTITYALLEKLEAVMEGAPDRVKLVTKARVTELLKDGDEVVGVKYEKEGSMQEAHGPVVLATGGFGADFTEGSLLKKLRPEYMDLPTTNGVHCTGDGIKMAQAVGGATIDLDMVQIHPTALVHPNEPDAKVKFLAAEALRGAGGIFLDKDGNRFVDELQKRDFVTGRMWEHNKGPYRLVLNGASSKSIEWHCMHYAGRGLMKKFASADEMAKDMGISVDKIKKTFDEFNQAAEQKNDKFGRKFFVNLPLVTDDTFYVGIVTPVIHYTLGGLKCNPDGEVLTESGKPVRGLFCGGEVAGGIHGKNRLGGSSLLDCVVYGRVSGGSAATYLMDKMTKGGVSGGSGSGGGSVNLVVDPATKSVTIKFDGSSSSSSAPAAAGKSGGKVPRDTQYAFEEGSSSDKSAEAKKGGPSSGKQEYTMEEVAKHTSAEDCWVVVGGRVLNVTKFLPEHPGGKEAILLYAGKDATEEYNMMHPESYIDKYAPQTVIGRVKGSSKL
ncbi:Fumarate reductase [Diplonema papillatum]|nr:Fumarate reductase [Diplonema papillatum]